MADPALGPAPDPAALRSAILARLGISADKLKGFGYDPAFDADVNNAYRKSMLGLSGLDVEQSRIGTDYERDVGQMMLKRDDARRSLSDMFADRGTLQSTNYANELSDLEQAYNTNLSGLATGKTRGLEDVTRQRTGMIDEFLRNKATSEGDYATRLQEFLLAQVQPMIAEKQAAAKLPVPRPIAAPRPAARASVAPVQRRASVPQRAVAPKVQPKIIPQIPLSAVSKNPLVRGGGAQGIVPGYKGPQ